MPVTGNPEILAALRPLTDLQRAYKWVSKDATYSASSNNEQSPKPLNGEHGCAYDDSFSVQTGRDPEPFVIIDLGGLKSCGLIDIQNRLNCIDRADNFGVSVGDEANGPWTEIWQNHDPCRTHWRAILDKPIACRYIKLMSKKSEHFHFNEIRVFEVK